MTNNLGTIGEKLVKRYLIRRFYKILKCNYNSKYGEIDIIAKRGKYLVFVEVKTRSKKFLRFACRVCNQAKATKNH